MWPWRKKNKEPEIVFLDGGKEPDYNKVIQLTQEEIDRHIRALEYKRDMLELDYETWRKKYGIMEQDEKDALFGLKKKEKKMNYSSNDLKLKNAKLKRGQNPFGKEEFYLRLVYEFEDQTGKYEVIIPHLMLPINPNKLILTEERDDYTMHRYHHADIGFGHCMLRKGIGHDSKAEAYYTVKELEKKVHKMTVADIEKKLGYKIEIVSEESEG